MAKLEFSIEIAAPADRVAVFFVPQRMPYWYGAEMEAEFEVQGGAADFAVGQKVRVSGRVGMKEVSLTLVITRFEFGRALEWRFADRFGVKGMQRWEIMASGSGTRVILKDEYELPGRLGRLADLLFTRHAVRARDRDYLARLKRLAERR
jgi:polyketide cyclase/dehydrase/lipid transport protein